MKPSGPWSLFVGTFLFADSNPILVTGLFRFSISSWFGLENCMFLEKFILYYICMDIYLCMFLYYTYTLFLLFFWLVISTIMFSSLVMNSSVSPNLLLILSSVFFIYCILQFLLVLLNFLVLCWSSHCVSLFFSKYIIIT